LEGDPLFFEGPEKKLELVISKTSASLRQKGDAFWKGIVEASRAQVLSKLSNESCDAYLLSESSLFVYDDHLVMITCGRTTLVQAALEILKEIPLAEVESFIYERKNEHFPQYQPSSFYDDIRLLKEVVPGKAYRFGDEDGHHVLLFHMDKPYVPESNDVTLEILMHGLDERASALFGQGPKHRLERIHAETGIREIFPDFKVDDYLFEPYGYSLNALYKEEYYTIHVTPQVYGSYASFEANRFFKDQKELEKTITRVIDIFRPKSYDIFLFQGPKLPKFLGESYELKEEIFQKLGCGYPVMFHHYFQMQNEPKPAFEISLETGEI
jgi:S-adenosylmethionine decarboxylase